MKTRLPFVELCALLSLMALGAATAGAAAVSHLRVHIVTGATDLSAGSHLELRIYEPGQAVRRLPLTHGEAWPSHSVHEMALTLGEPLEPRNVSRFSLYYRAATALAPPWEVVAAEVDVASGREPARLLLDATLAGVIPRQGELATAERDAGTMRCISDADCDDQRSCNGQERCAPQAVGADAHGCIKGAPMVCPVNQVCGEQHGCRGASMESGHEQQ